VIITTNEERELPAAFLRRCLVLQYELPDDIVPWLISVDASTSAPRCAATTYSKPLPDNWPKTASTPGGQVLRRGRPNTWIS
jgi:MoxR-like ATPase